MKNDQAEISLEELQKGSDAVLRMVYESNRDKFLNFAKRYNLSHDENIDIYQDAYITFYDNVMSGKLSQLSCSVSTYLFSIGKYKIFERMRNNKKKVGDAYDLSRMADADADAHVAVEDLELSRPELTPQQQLLQEHFTGLGAKCQELLTLFYYRGFTIQEIMAHENYNSENVVKATKSRCMKTLRERIKQNS